MKALSVNDADRDRAVAQQTRQVVMASLGVIKELKADHRRTRSVAVAATLLIFFVVGPPVWWMADMLIEEERLTSLASELAVWGFLMSTALLGSALAGRMATAAVLIPLVLRNFLFHLSVHRNSD